jgi:hypothetical protein
MRQKLAQKVKEDEEKLLRYIQSLKVTELPEVSVYVVICKLIFTIGIHY